MADRNFDIDIIIRARNFWQRELQGVTKQLGDVQKEVDKLNRKNQDLDKRIDSINAGLAELGQTGRSSVELVDRSFDTLSKRVGKMIVNIHGLRSELKQIGNERNLDPLVKQVGDSEVNVNKLYVSLRYYFPIENKFTWDKKSERKKEREKRKPIVVPPVENVPKRITKQYLELLTDDQREYVEYIRKQRIQDSLKRSYERRKRKLQERKYDLSQENDNLE